VSIDRDDELDRVLDRFFVDGEPPPEPPLGHDDDFAGFRQLIAADASTEAADPAFLGNLRAELLRRDRGRAPRFDARSVGIAAPGSPLDLSRERDRRLLAIVAAAAILLAVVGSGVRWGRDGHPRMNVATAQASTIPNPTPTMIATLTIAIEATR
jgi:hypothetical protein